MSFEKLSIIEPILRALKAEGYTKPTPIQEQAIPVVLQGRDLVGCAQTGTGKTAAFAIPILQGLIQEPRPPKTPRPIRALVLAPTRELAIQIGESFTAYGKHMGIRNTVIFGGVSQQPQTKTLKSGVDILVATPGRLLDLMQQKFISLNHINFFVLDEADRMLEMGMVEDVKKIIAKLPKVRQTLLFSATMPKEITKLVDSILVDPARIAVNPVSSTIDIIEQSVYFVNKKDKRNLLGYLLKNKSITSVLVFSRTKHGANRITKDLMDLGIKAEAIHGNKSQTARQLALSNFKEGKTRVLVATDIAARGIDVEELSHVINYDLPNIPETYVHRIGRTGRAGHGGVAISFCDIEERPYLKDIEKLIGKTVPVVKDHPYVLGASNPSAPVDLPRKPYSNRPGHKSGSKPESKKGQTGYFRRGKAQSAKKTARKKTQ